MLSRRALRRKKLWPSWLVALIAVIQLLLTFSVVGLETTSFIFDAWHSMSFAGFYCPLFFMITWISMFTVSEYLQLTVNLAIICLEFFLLACCNRGSLACATHVLVENILSIIAASVLLYFNNLFLNNPYTCLFRSTYECSYSYYNRYSNTSYYSSYSNGIYDNTSYTVKLACIKAELACGSLMLTSCVAYIIIYAVVAVLVGCKDDEPYTIPNRLDMGPIPPPVPNFPPPPPLAAAVVPTITSMNRYSLISNNLLTSVFRILYYDLHTG